MEETKPVQGQQEAKLPFLTKVILIFTNPSKVFANLKIYPDWLLPMVLILVFTIGSSFVLKDLGIAAAKQKILDSDQFPEEQKEQIIERMEQGGSLQLVMGVVGPIIFIFAAFAIAAGVFYLTGNFIFGGTTTFKTMFSVYTWGYVVSILEALIKVPLALAKNSVNVYTSLAVFFDPAESDTTLFKLANAVDIFSLWRLFLWGLGISIIYKFSQGKAYGIVIFWYVVWTLISIGLSSVIPFLNM
jgi:hypothetical protein